jgi:hypothetical protein
VAPNAISTSFIGVSSNSMLGTSGVM